MNRNSQNRAEKWLDFDYPGGCALDEYWKQLYRKGAALIKEGVLCPYLLCSRVVRADTPCGEKTAAECALLCDNFYKKYIEGEKE